MSTSRFFNPSAPRRYPKNEVVSEEVYKTLHWTRQLELRPLRSQTRREWPEGDFNTLIDMFDDNEINDTKEITE
jgi:hypothetical protein